jgi:hypothetical protein
MNKILSFFLAVCFSVLIPAMGQAQESTDPEYKEASGEPSGAKSRPPVEIPPGMEMINIGGIHMIVPEGMKITKKGSQISMEGTEDFTARNFKEMKIRFAKMEADQKDLEKQVDELKQKTSDLRKNDERIEQQLLTRTPS